jgi:hypothetical protein
MDADLASVITGYTVLTPACTMPRSSAVERQRYARDSLSSLLMNMRPARDSLKDTCTSFVQKHDVSGFQVVNAETSVGYPGRYFRKAN